MAKTNQRTPSASQRREKVRQERQKRLVDSPGKQSQTRNTGQGRRAQKQKRGPWLLIGGVLVVLALVIGIFYYIGQHQSNTPVAKSKLASSNVMQQVTNVDSSVLSTVAGGGTTPPTSVSSHVLLTGSGGKPLIFYDGAEFCPYCAAERWGVVVALNRFGSFGNLHVTSSSASDVYPSTNTFTFYQSTYTSSYIDFLSVEETTNQSDNNGGYTPLQTPTAQEQQLLTTFKSQGFPFIDIANKFIVNTPGYSPQVLQGLNWDEIANDLSNASSPVTQGIVGTANYLTAAICESTSQQPTSACKAAPIPQLEKSLIKSASQGTSLATAPGSFVAETVGFLGDAARKR